MHPKKQSSYQIGSWSRLCPSILLAFCCCGIQVVADSGPSSTPAFTATLMSGNTSGNLYKIWCSFVSCQSAKYTLRDQCANDFYRSVRIAFVGKKSRQWCSSRDLIGDIKDAQAVDIWPIFCISKWQQRFNVKYQDIIQHSTDVKTGLIFAWIGNCIRSF